MQQAHAHTHICQNHSNAKETLRNQLMQQQNPHGQGFPTNMFVGVIADTAMWQLVKLTSILDHMHVT